MFRPSMCVCMCCGLGIVFQISSSCPKRVLCVYSSLQDMFLFMYFCLPKTPRNFFFRTLLSARHALSYDRSACAVFHSQFTVNRAIERKSLRAFTFVFCFFIRLILADTCYVLSELIASHLCSPTLLSFIQFALISAAPYHIPYLTHSSFHSLLSLSSHSIFYSSRPIAHTHRRGNLQLPRSKWRYICGSCGCGRIRCQAERVWARARHVSCRGMARATQPMAPKLDSIGLVRCTS